MAREFPLISITFWKKCWEYWRRSHKLVLRTVLETTTEAGFSTLDAIVPSISLIRWQSAQSFFSGMKSRRLRRSLRRQSGCWASELFRYCAKHRANHRIYAREVSKRAAFI